ncbi:MAG: hypothetical protein H6817_05075 [Phycisphaerales bacterium]|nr:hypothetical protein [Phycisphaerales bacterium]
MKLRINYVHSALRFGCRNDGHPNDFIWVLDDERALEILDKITHLADSEGPGHQYLAVEDDEDAEIVLSKDEHSLDVFSKAV